jgi:hypothetical protein
MVGVDSEMTSSVLRLWIAAGSAAVLVAICAVAISGLRTNAARAGVVALGALVCVAMIWALLGNPIAQDHGADRRALELRAQELTARTLAPGSALACLDAIAGENVDAACEKALFASAATVAAATSYAAARLELLSDMAAYVKHGGRDIDGALLPLRHSLETDAYGFVAHALAVRDGCTGSNCKALDVLRDASRVRANLTGQTLDRYLDRYLTAWAQQPDSPAPVADAATQSQPTYQPGGPGPRKTVNIDFPTSASIPPVSIMNPEPTAKTASAGAAATAANPNPPAPVAATASVPPPAKKPRKQAANPPAQPPAPAPAAAAEQPDPVWMPAPPAPPAQAAATAPAPAANFSGGAGPVAPLRSPQ